jgi:hypothetical protein
MEMQSKKGKEPRRRQQGKRGCTGNCTGVMRHHSRRPNDAPAVLLQYGREKRNKFTTLGKIYLTQNFTTNFKIIGTLTHDI